MKFKFQTFVDISTSASSMQVIQWSVGGPKVLERCRHLFGAFKYFKLGKISVKMVPASTLPVDPLGLSYDSSDPQTVDPRDQMNPGLVRITNGEDVFTNVSVLNNDLKQEGVYNAMMLDPRWSKFMLQSGFNRSAYPLYWQVGQLHQDKYPGATVNIPTRYTVQGSGAVDSVNATKLVSSSNVDGTGNPTAVLDALSSDPRGFFQVGHRGKIGWLPTDYYQELPVSGQTSPKVMAGPNNVPEVSVITCVLPKAYKTLYYYRVFITEEVYFTGMRSTPVETSVSGVGSGYYLGIDQHMFSTPYPNIPGNSLPEWTTFNSMNVQNDGQGDL